MGPDHDWIARADVRDPMRDARDAAKRHLRVVERALGVVPSGRPNLRARWRALWFTVAPGGRRRALRHLAAGLRADLEATEQAAGWLNARVTYQTVLAERLARGAPRRTWTGAAERPVLLLGTGGGGTRVLAEASARLGLFLGATVNESFDSVAWAPLVYELAAALDGATELPFGDHARARILETARATYEPWHAVGEPFGWKLPEALLVLPLFLDAFPQARVVLLVRHPVSAAFRRPHVTTTPAHPLGRGVLAGAYRAAGRDVSLLATDPPYLRQALAWRHQIGRADRWLAERVPVDRVLRLRLEEFALSPRATVARLAAHLECPPQRPGDATLFDEERIGKRPDPRQAAHVRELCGEVAARVGYGPGWLDARWEAPERRKLFLGLA